MSLRLALALAAMTAVAACRPDPALAAPADPAELWRWSAAAVGHVVDGDLVAAFSALTRARTAQAAPELDTLAGLAALQGGERQAALRRLSAAATAAPDQPLTYYWLARVEQLLGHIAPALARMEQAIAVGGDRPALRVGHALLLQESGQADRAATSLLAAAAVTADLLDPSLFPGPVDGAVELLEPLFRRFPSRTRLLRTQGHLFWRGGRALAAQRCFRELLKLDGEDADAWQMLGRTQLALGEGPEARASLERALRLSPDLPQALAGRGELLLEAGEAARAVEDLRRAVDALPRDARLLARLAEACAAAERPDCARRFYTYALGRDDHLAAAHFGLGLLEQQSGAPDKARQHLERALALGPGVPRYYEAAAQLESTRDPARARRWLAEARRAGQHDAVQRRRLESAKQEASLQTTALRELSASSRCQTAACRSAVARLAEAPRTFLQAHLCLKRGDRRQALQLIRSLLPRLRAKALLAGDPTLIETAGQTGSGRGYLLRSVAPRVPTARFR